LGTEDEIITMRPDGSDPVTLAGPDPDIERTQPTWSPDGSRVAWTERRADQETYLLLADSDGGDVIEWPSPLLAVYIAWGPDGEHLALTGNDGEGDLLLAIAGSDGDIQVIDEGAPLYFDWAPDGTEVLARVSGRFEYLAIDGSGRETVPVTGEFRLGAHVAESVLIGTERDVGEALALANRQGEIERELLRYAAPMAFVADQAGSRVAVMSRGSAESQALSRLGETDLPIIDAERLIVVATSDGTLEEVSPARNIAWFWSPDGRELLYSTVEFIDGIERLQWHIWDGEETKSYRPFSPTGVFGRDYLAYFDQFALSISLWAPDGSAFAYAGGDSLEDAGIWVQNVGGENPVRVSPGEVALWSPVS
jgi:Tol biopolymer transport system component